MSKQKIILIDQRLAGHGLKTMDTIEEFNDEMKRRAESPQGAGNSRVFIGEERCIKEVVGRASTQYKISDVGCDCGN